LKKLHADGGPTRDRFLMQFTADITGVELSVSEVAESSAWGAAMNGLLGLGRYSSPGEFAKLPRKQIIFRPQMKAVEVKKFHDGWLVAVKRVL
jgi:glycerol kinase